MRRAHAAAAVALFALASCQAYDRGRYQQLLDGANDTETTADASPVDVFMADAVDAFDAPSDLGIDGPRDVVGDTVACSSGQTRSCYTGPSGTRSNAPCHAGTQMCLAGGTWDTACTGQVLPMAHEVCFNGIDDDCNGTVDDGCPTQRSCMNAGTPGCGLVEVAAGGPFMMGEVGIENAEPVQPSITVTRPLAVDAYEVTVARFRAYWNAGHPAPGASVMYPSGALAWQGPVVEPTTLTGMSCNWTSSAGTLERHPINCIDWYTAQAFCVWDGGRLPTEAEMEWIARGRPIAGIPSPRTYPWGNTDPMGSSSGTCDLAQWHYCTGQDGQHTVHVGSFPPSGGIYDLVGNVAEYAADNFYAYSGALCWGGTARTDPLCDTDPSPTGGRPRRGGSFGALMVSQVGGAGRVGVAANFRGDYVGMRCVREH